MAGGEGTVYVLTQTVSDSMKQTRMFSPDRSERNVLGLTVGSRRSHTLPTLPQDFVLLTLLAVVCIYVLPKRVYRWMRSKPVEGKAGKDA